MNEKKIYIIAGKHTSPRVTQQVIVLQGEVKLTGRGNDLKAVVDKRIVLVSKYY